ncbi:type IV pilus biogenesis/stability protein PilW [Thalassotalea psychrophila]|uniref:Type IV pilus biogenesis/stability protein PilW n=1 Tax=Thalassotalea psychrophila TaxID=3065647 RepID=A0ABY9TTE8_9GAMM|nr:type IV pilus biogenesis/stability protein PilW [Colwelliaceae bacterium SQ149]
MRKLVQYTGKITFIFIALAGLSACVTQNFSEDKPVVERDFSDDQIARTRISLALGYLRMGNTAQAKFNLEKAKQYSPNLVDVYTAFAHYYESVGEFEKTEDSYLQALSIEDGDADTLNNFGVFLCRQNRVDEAEKYFLKAIEVPTYIRVSESYENIALCHLKVEQYTKAEHALKRSIAHSPNSPSSLMQMAQLQYAKGSYEKSANYLSRFELATRRFTPQAIALAFKVQKKLGNEDVSNNYATMLLKMFPDSSQAKAYLDNELVQIEADDLALKYRKYKLINSGVKINKKPVVVLTKAKPNQIKSDGFKQKEPVINFSNEKLVDDATIAQQTGQSIAKNSQIDTQMKPKTGHSQPASKQVNNTPKTVPVKSMPVKTVVASAKPKVNTATKAQTPAPAQKSISIADLDNPVHTVQKGENLYQISVKYNITISTIRRWNDLTKESINVGQVLRLTKP